MSYDFLNQPVSASLSLAVRDDDAFFSPVRLGHTGFAYDGFSYTSGVQNPAVTASWYSEGPSETRGAKASFPTQAVVLVSRASITILDATTGSLDLWMIFYLSDSFAFPNNLTSGTASFTPASATWADGMLSVVLKADPGSAAMPVVVVTFDFSADQVYADYSLV